MNTRIVLLGLFSFLSLSCIAQDSHDMWLSERLNAVTWQKSYSGMLAEYHPVTFELASDGQDIAGYFIHSGDRKKHRISGDWSENGLFQLQERDEYDRLTGYLTGIIKDDHLALKWMSVAQDRVFDIKASTEKMVSIKRTAPIAEWITTESDPSFVFSIQKTELGKVFGLAIDAHRYVRFEGSCLDGTCSIWKASFIDPDGELVNLQMTQKTPTSYKATINNVPGTATVRYSSPLVIQHEDNSNGFIDFTYPEFKGKAYTQWIDSFQMTDQAKLMATRDEEVSPRLAYRSSGWVEIVDETEDYISGLVTFINPEGGSRKSFVLMKKGGELLMPNLLFNEQVDYSAVSDLALTAMTNEEDDIFFDWCARVGYTCLVPTVHGLLVATEFNAVYGDDLRCLSIDESKKFVRKKYWKYFGW